ncbi:hypothetical protein D3H55_22820 [Bacillus salacetis]|uniref:DUF3137 domain-containing protein n=1 Tax=Bacillus salacetis TaxID=2315464 RepID=A0A3A1QRU1_9BACI|nr:hypothetical protein [Bacillus salacetis]RIW27625.1 hypothetical protein D3H55_22820 [Bacillus salacetis]
MKRLSIIRPYINVLYWIVLIIVAVVSALIIYNIYSVLIENWFVTITSIITLIGSIVTLKDLSKRFQRFLYKSKVILRNRQIAWSLDGRYKGTSINLSTFSNIKEFIKDIGENNTIISENANDISLNIDGVIIQCSYREEFNEDIYSETSNVGEITIYIPEYHAPYVEANVLLEQRIIPILNELKQKVGECSEAFTFDVFFKEQHPYLGLYLKGFGKNRDLTFNCSFVEAPITKGITDESTIIVSKKKLSVNTKTLYNLDRLIHKHLFLSGG